MKRGGDEVKRERRKEKREETGTRDKKHYKVQQYLV
jgi:hypothetical protein